MQVDSIPFLNSWENVSTKITKLKLSTSNINQEVLDSLSKHLRTKECFLSELVFDGIKLSNLNYLCCLIPNTRIQKLSLRCCWLKDMGIKDLLAILDETNEKTQLKSLNLDCNGITCEGAKNIAQVLRTNRTLQSLSLAKNAIKDEGVLAILGVLSIFKLNDNETKWKNSRELRRIRIIEYLMDVISLKSKEKQRENSLNETSRHSRTSSINIMTDENLKQKAESMLVPNSHAYLTGQLLKIGSHFYCQGNFTIEFLNISFNNFSPNVLSVIEQLIQYQKKICLPEEGIRVLKVDGFDAKKVEKIYQLTH